MTNRTLPRPVNDSCMGRQRKKQRLGCCFPVKHAPLVAQCIHVDSRLENGRYGDDLEVQIRLWNGPIAELCVEFNLI